MDRHTLTARNLRRIAKWEKEATLTLEAKRHHDAAPDMLAALRLAADALNPAQSWSDQLASEAEAAVRAAIAKATGNE